MTTTLTVAPEDVAQKEESSIEEPIQSPLNTEAEKICRTRYYQKDEQGNPIEDWAGLVNRVVNHVCGHESEDYKNEMYGIIYKTHFLPNSPCLVNAGNSVSGCLACFVSPAPEDSWEGMVKNIGVFGHVARRGGGNGVSFSKIRPANDPVFGSTHAKACGPIEHMRMVSEVMHSITQSGFRAMAMMSTLDVTHPDVMDFIVCKQRDRALKTLLREDIFNHYEQIKYNTHEHLNIVLDKFLSNFNISVVVSDKFMEAVKKDDNWDLVFNGKLYRTLKAREIFNAMAENAWKNGDPGMLFYDRMNDGPYKYSKQEINATNPCGEQILPDTGSCNLGSIDVSKFYDPETNNVNWKHLKKTIHTCVRFLDNVLDANKFPTPEFKKWAKENRPVGLGIMGFADLLLKLKLTYGKQKSLEFAEELSSFFEKEAHKASVKLGIEKGTPECCQFNELEHRRNVTTISIAPTGSISQLAGCNSSIEPFFSTKIVRYDNTGQRTSDNELADKSYFRCAVDPDQKPGREVTWQEHVKMQSVFQKHTDSGVSKTINCPNDATIDDVKKAYMMAYETGCKGITIYRDGSKTTQVLNTEEKHIIQSQHMPMRPREVEADIFRTKADGFDWHIIIGKVDRNPYELFAVNGSQSLPENGRVIKRKKKHYSLVDENNNVLIDNLSEQERNIDKCIDKETRRFSLELRHGIAPKFIVQQIEKSNDVVTSFAKAVSRIFKTKYMTVEDYVVIAEDVACPNCAKNGKRVQLIPEAGCWKCVSCSYSRCG